jgi:molybdenum-dependent DNA-binding transcriptional regulator ModE
MALAGLEAEELEEEPGGAELGGAELEAVGEELLQLATASPMHAIDTTAAICAPRR